MLGFRDTTISIRGFAWFTDAQIDRVRDQIFNSHNEIFGDISIPFSVLIEAGGGLRIYDFEQNVFLNNDRIIDTFDNAYNIIASVKNKIQGNPNQSQYVSRLNIRGGLLKRNTFEFQSVSVDINMAGPKGTRFISTGRNSDGIVLLPYVMQVVLWYPQGNGDIIQFKNDPDNGYPNDNNIIGKSVTLIDSVQVTTKIPDDVLNPTFTRIQTPFRRKETYSPTIVHETDFTDLGVAQRITNLENKLISQMFRENTFKTKPGDTTRTIDYRDTNDSLEQITTQLKLNDFRRRTQVFEGDVASNHNGYPLFPVQTIDIDFNDWKSGRLPRTQNKAEATIFWGGRYNLSTGLFTISTFTPNQFTDISPENRSDINTSDFDIDGQLQPGYYTNRPTAFQDLPERVISGGEAPEPEPEPATMFRITPNQVQRVRVSNNIGNATIPFNVRADGRYTLKGEIFVGNMHIPIELDDRGRLTKIIGEGPATGFIELNNKKIAILHLDIDIPVEGNEETTKIRIDIVRYQIIPSRIITPGTNTSNDIINVLSNLSPTNGRPINIIDFTQKSITGEKVQIRYDRMMMFLRPHPTDSEGVVAKDPLPIQDGDPIIIDYNNNTLVIIEAPTESLEPREVTTNELRVTFNPTNITFNIDLDGAFLANRDVTVNVVSDDFTYFDFDYQVSGRQQATEPITGISVIKSGNNMINVSVNGFLLPRGKDNVQAFIQLFLGGTIQPQTLLVRVNIANHREADDTTL